MRYVALLRGINVGGHRSIRMADLKAMFESAGATDVATYIQSGNVVFSHESRAPGPALEAAIKRATKLDVPILVRTARELGALVDNNAFPGDEAHLHVLFLTTKTKVTIVATPPEMLAQRGSDLYVCFPNGVGRSKLVVQLGKLGGTLRNWRTILALHAMIRA